MRKGIIKEADNPFEPGAKLPDAVHRIEWLDVTPGRERVQVHLHTYTSAAAANAGGQPLRRRELMLSRERYEALRPVVEELLAGIEAELLANDKELKETTDEALPA